MAKKKLNKCPHENGVSYYPEFCKVAWKVRVWCRGCKKAKGAK